MTDLQQRINDFTTEIIKDFDSGENKMALTKFMRDGLEIHQSLINVLMADFFKEELERRIEYAENECNMIKAQKGVYEFSGPINAVLGTFIEALKQKQ